MSSVQAYRQLGQLTTRLIELGYDTGVTHAGLQHAAGELRALEAVARDAKDHAFLAEVYITRTFLRSLYKQDAKFHNQE